MLNLSWLTFSRVQAAVVVPLRALYSVSPNEATVWGQARELRKKRSEAGY